MSLVWSEYNKNVLIIGYGVVGKNLAKELEPIDYEIRDINIPEYNNSTNKTYRVAFVCVPTEMLPDGSVDTSCVEDAVANVKAQVIVIKSAIPPGTAKTLSNRYSKHIVVSPEYYGATIHAIATPDFLILGGAKGDCQKVAELYYEFKPSDYTIRFTTWETAELSKYMENCYLALKVTFCNEFADIAHSYGVSYPELREVFVSDPRVGRSHIVQQRSIALIDARPSMNQGAINPATLYTGLPIRIRQLPDGTNSTFEFSCEGKPAALLFVNGARTSAQVVIYDWVKPNTASGLGINLVRRGNTVSAFIKGTTTTAISSAGVLLGTIPIGFRPSSILYTDASNQTNLLISSNGKLITVNVVPTGLTGLSDEIPLGTPIYGNTTWLVD